MSIDIRRYRNLVSIKAAARCYIDARVLWLAHRV
jgi:hypothetical protein